jgi:bifunctional non-homologous end joining protein LigD
MLVTHADRVVFPATGYTKGQVVAYYEALAPRILEHARARPLTIRRYPKGTGQPGFFQKNVPPHYPASIARVELPRREGVTIHPVLSEEEHLAYIANQGAIELHVPCTRIDDLAHADRLVIDLDPPEGAIDLVRRAAHIVREEMERFGLPTCVIATGSKGYHVVAAIRPTVPAEVVAVTLQKLGALLAEGYPNELTTAFRIAKRGGKVFVDWMRNMPNATVVAPYSLRARPRASVATPLSWAELDSTLPDAFTLADAELLVNRPDTLADLASKPTDAQSFVQAVDSAFEEAKLELERFDRFRS